MKKEKEEIGDKEYFERAIIANKFIHKYIKIMYKPIKERMIYEKGEKKT